MANETTKKPKSKARRAKRNWENIHITMQWRPAGDRSGRTVSVDIWMNPEEALRRFMEVFAKAPAAKWDWDSHPEIAEGK